MKYIEGMKCPLCKSTKCILTDNEFDYKCLNCNHEGYFGQEELEGKTPPKFSEDEDDEPFHVSHAEFEVLSDPDYNGKYQIGTKELERLIRRLRNKRYFGDVDDSFFEDDVSAPSRGTEEYRQWYEYNMAKGYYNILGSSPSPEELEEDDEPQIAIYVRKGTAEKGDCFYNAPGTSDSIVEIDGEEYYPIDAWEEATGEDRPSSCPNHFCKAKTKNDKLIVGAHVISEYQEEDISDGQTCYIISLCKSCNSSGIDKDIILKRDIPIIELVW